MHERLSLLLPVWHRRPARLPRGGVPLHASRSRPAAPTRSSSSGTDRSPPRSPATLAELADDSPVPVDVVELERNVGLGPALDAGLAACTHDVVARMDADDISLPHRFAVQMPIVEAGADLVGAGLLEFGERRRRRRRPPHPADRPRRHPRPRPVRRPVQPPHGRLPAQLRAGRRRLRRLRADGGLPALGEDDRRGGAGGERRRAAGALPGRRRGVRAPRGAGAAAHGAAAAAPLCARSGSRRGPSSRATSSCAAGTGSSPEGVRRAAYRRMVAPYGDRGVRQAYPSVLKSTSSS